MKTLLYLMSSLASRFSERQITRFALIMGWIWFHVFRYRRRVVLANLRQAFPELEPPALALRAKNACVHLVRVMLECLRIPKYVSMGLDTVVRVEGVEHWRSAAAKGKGVLIVTGHFGSWELGAGASTRHFSPIHLVVKPLPSWLNGFATELRRSMGLDTIPAEGGLKEILRALRHGETVVFVLDQNATRQLGVFVDFFGRTASTMAGLAVIAAKTGAPVIAASVYREADGRHVVAISPEIPLERQETRDQTIVHMTQIYTRYLQASIQAHPEQWFWTHRRWKTRPLEEKTSAAEITSHA